MPIVSCLSVYLSVCVYHPCIIGTNNDSFELLQENSKSHCGHRVGIAHTRWATHGKPGYVVFVYFLHIIPFGELHGEIRASAARGDVYS